MVGSRDRLRRRHSRRRGSGGGGTDSITLGLTAKFDFQQGADATKLYEVSGTATTGDFFGGANAPTWALGGQAVDFNGASGSYVGWDPVGRDISQHGDPCCWFTVFAASDLTFNSGHNYYVVVGNGANAQGIRRAGGGTLLAPLAANDYSATVNELDDAQAVTLNKPVLVASRRKDGEMALWSREQGRSAIKRTKVPAPTSIVAANINMHFGSYWEGLVGAFRGRIYWTQWHAADLSDAEIVQNMQYIAEQVALKGVTV